MPFELWLGFVAASVVLVIIPGPTILTVISYSISQGRQATMPLVAGVALGDCTSLSLSIIGLGALFSASAYLFNLFKWIGGIYMLYLGIKLLVAGSSPSKVSAPSAQATNWELFTSTYIVTALNPSGIAFFVAFLPQFVNPNTNVTNQLWILAITFVMLATINSTLYALFASTARQIMSSPRAHLGFSLAGGSLLIAAGIWALIAKRPA